MRIRWPAREARLPSRLERVVSIRKPEGATRCGEVHEHLSALGEARAADQIEITAVNPLERRLWVADGFTHNANGLAQILRHFFRNQAPLHQWRSPPAGSPFRTLQAYGGSKSGPPWSGLPC